MWDNQNLSQNWDDADKLFDVEFGLPSSISDLHLQHEKTQLKSIPRMCCHLSAYLLKSIKSTTSRMTYPPQS